jgi:serine phosphatase RsbU (regulator of sigma subunit)
MPEAEPPTQLITQTEDEGLAGRALLSRLRHELRTPLNAVIGYSELLLEEADASEFYDSLRKMLAAGRELLSYVTDLLDPALLAARRSELGAEPTGADVRHQLRTSLTTVSGYCELSLEEAAEAGRAEVIGDLERIRRSAEKFLTLIDSLVDLAQIEKTGMTGKEAGPHAAQAAPVPEMIRGMVNDPSPPGADGMESLRSATGSLLVVDDNEINRDLLVRRLAREGHQVSVATNGRQALEMIEGGNFDLVLLDILMPEMNGYQALERLKAQGRLRDLPVIMLSAFGDLESVAQCIGLGAEDYLSKPYDPVLLRARIGASLEKKRLRDRLRERLKAIEQELDLAARIQQSILPREFPTNERIEVFAEMTPARAIGGDFYDFFQIGESRFGFAIADVSGKGAPAALFMALSRAFLKATAVATAVEDMSAGECLERVNRLIYAENQAGMFVTVFYGILNTRTGEVEFANAGHNHPYLLRAGAPPELLNHRHSLVIGAMKKVAYPTHRLQLRPGDRLFLYTDGVTEAMNEAGDLFSEERLEQALARADGGSLKDIASVVSREVLRFADGAPQSDDLTMLIVEHRG